MWRTTLIALIDSIIKLVVEVSTKTLRTSRSVAWKAATFTAHALFYWGISIILRRTGGIAIAGVEVILILAECTGSRGSLASSTGGGASNTFIIYDDKGSRAIRHASICIEQIPTFAWCTIIHWNRTRTASDFTLRTFWFIDYIPNWAVTKTGILMKIITTQTCRTSLGRAYLTIRKNIPTFSTCSILRCGVIWAVPNTIPIVQGVCNLARKADGCWGTL